ncbi:hypothetical protein Bbelb_377750 [Branchiostoma belcheri]|nr:hypothetical protein Bbelb_377750 [Branchiostoma belcheri]
MSGRQQWRSQTGDINEAMNMQDVADIATTPNTIYVSGAEADPGAAYFAAVDTDVMNMQESQTDWTDVATTPNNINVPGADVRSGDDVIKRKCCKRSKKLWKTIGIAFAFGVAIVVILAYFTAKGSSSHEEKLSMGIDHQTGLPGPTESSEGKGPVGMDGQTGLPGSTGSPEEKGPLGMDGQAGLPGSAGSPEEKGSVVMDGQAGLPGSTGSSEGKGRVGMDGQAGLPGSTGSPEGKDPVGMDGHYEECLVEKNRRQDCGYPGITPVECHDRGCCFNNVPYKSTWCYFKQESCQYAGEASCMYRGTVSVTNTGKTCQRWDSQIPHEHIKTPAAYPLAGLEQNYCRNPDGEPGVWCFTTDPNSRWELCDVPSCVSCQYADGASYRGTVSVTKTGKTCQRWDSQTPHEHIKTPGAYPSAGLERNYCRNPDGELGVWCFTTDPNSRWELCDVPSCVSCQYADGAFYRGTVSVTKTGKTCQRWDSQTPHEHSMTGAYPSAGLERNYCRNPDGDRGVWCYTTDPSSRWELCDVPSCGKI